MKPAGYFLLAILAVMYLQETTAKGKNPLWKLDDAGQCYERRKKDANVMSCEAGGRLIEQVSSLEQTVAEMQTTISNQTDVIAKMQADLEEKKATDLPADCEEVRAYDQNDGVHTLAVDGVQIEVYCDQTTDGGGWTVIQRRIDGSVSFDRNWTDYEEGFGELRGEFWLGLSNIHRLTSGGDYSLRVDLTDWDNATAYALYDTFYIDGSDQNYRLHVAGYSGTAGDCLIKSATGVEGHIHNNQPFSTPDNDHDQFSTNCAARFHSGWWYNGCHNAHLNGQYGQSGSRGYQYIIWFSWHNDWRSYKHASMMIKPRH